MSQDITELNKLHYKTHNLDLNFCCWLDWYSSLLGSELFFHSLLPFLSTSTSLLMLIHLVQIPPKIGPKWLQWLPCFHNFCSFHCYFYCFHYFLSFCKFWSSSTTFASFLEYYKMKEQTYLNHKVWLSLESTLLCD